MIKICLSGFGKMNKEVYSSLLQESNLQVVSILRPHVEKFDGIIVSTNPREAFAPAEVVIDFSTKEACLSNAVIAAEMGKNIVIGTTGMAKEDIERIRNAIEKNKVSGVLSANFSIGVNVFIETAKSLYERLKAYDLEVVETHHKAKKDAPSGTALRTLGALGKTQEQVPVHSLRIGDVIGDHTVVFAGNAERIELTHRATSRRCFAQGAILSAKWIKEKKDGILHDFRDVIK